MCVEICVDVCVGMYVCCHGICAVRSVCHVCEHVR